jgi:2-polyprenyl-6-methoxyphenol hydroxylase-like FAD-dependent oxidoreductase
MMMQVFNARERELDDWKALAAQVGLEVTNVQQPFGSVMGILEISAKTDAHAQRQESTDKVGEETSEKPVLICGAGISGLSLAQSLRKNGIPFRVFERDPAVDSRPQGYRLKLEADAAQALKESLTEDVYKSFESSCALHAVGETDFNPFSGQVIKSRAGGGLSGTQGLHASYTVDRSAFRTTLMTGIEESIEFGKEISSYEVDPETSTVVATFKDGAQVHGRFLVAADGLHSTVRRQHIPHAELVDTGGFCVYGKTVMSPELLALFPEKAMRWMTVVSDEAPMLQSALIGTKTVTLLTEPIRFSSESHAQHDLPADYVYWALIGPKERFGPDDITSVRYNKSPEQAALEAAKLVLDVTREWHPSIRALFELQDTRQASAIKVFSSLPKIQKWQSHSHVTVLGDSIHPMSPCGGVGANTALVDGARLAKVLVAAGGSPTVEAVAAFEEDMRQRAFRNICRSEIGSKMMFGAKSLVECEAAKF